MVTQYLESPEVDLVRSDRARQELNRIEHIISVSLKQCPQEYLTGGMAKIRQWWLACKVQLPCTGNNEPDADFCRSQERHEARPQSNVPLPPAAPLRERAASTGASSMKTEPTDAPPPSAGASSSSAVQEQEPVTKKVRLTAAKATAAKSAAKDEEAVGYTERTSKKVFPKQRPRSNIEPQQRPPAPEGPPVSTVTDTTKDEPISKGSGKSELGKKRPRDAGTSEHASQVIPDRRNVMGTQYRLARLT